MASSFKDPAIKSQDDLYQMKYSSIFPLIFFFILALGLALITHLGSKPNFVPRMIGQKVESFETTDILTDEKFSSQELNGKITVLNLFASWCESCKVEHPLLKNLSDQGIEIYGLDVADSKVKALEYLKQNGNPYKKVGADPDRKIALGLGITGVPETYVINKDGVIFFHQRGMIDRDIINQQILPIIEGLKKK